MTQFNNGFFGRRHSAPNAAAQLTIQWAAHALAQLPATLFNLPTTLFRAACRGQSAYENRLALRDLDTRLLDDVGLKINKRGKITRKG